ncbi:hypothetical protein M1583_03025 [Candidatus Marsarchaeota archaeon]|nr:hypothetical protein [Candidatus Marsarchaeota archaeon]
MEIKKEQTKVDHNALMASVRNMQFDYAEKAINNLESSKNTQFKNNVASVKSLITSICALTEKNYELGYDPIAFVHMLNKYTRGLRNYIDLIYETVYEMSNKEIKELKDAYLNSLVDSLGGEVHTRKEYARKLEEINNSDNKEHNVRLKSYLKDDLRLLRKAESELRANHAEYLYALDPDSKYMNAQILESIFMIDGLNDISKINFEKLQEEISEVRHYVSTSSSENMESLIYNINELARMREYVLSLPAQSDYTEEDLSTEFKLNKGKSDK